MNISKHIRNFFPHLYMVISIEDKTCSISYEVYKSDQQIHSEKKDFTINNQATIDPYILRYIQAIQIQYRHHYIALISNTSKQGILTHCNNSMFAKNNIRKADVKYVCIENKWGTYISKEGFLKELEYFDELNIDLYYSPFSILSHYISDHKIVDQTTLFILNRINSISIIIVKNNQYLFGTHFNLDEDVEVLEDVEEDFDQEIDSDDEEMFALDDFSFDDDLEDLEDLEEITEETNTQTTETNTENATQELEILGRDLKTFSYIKSAIDDFYTQGNIEFIDKIIIYDNEDISSDVIDFIENDLLLSVDVKQVNILETAIEFVKKEEIS